MKTTMMTMTKKTLISTMALAFTLPVFSIETPERNNSGEFNNINDRKEYKYEISPSLVFWREGGRPFWRSQSTTAEQRANLTPEERVGFKMEQASLDPNDKKTLKELARKLKNEMKQVEEVWIMGFASRPGTRGFNMKLSQKRADNVRDFLVQQGVDGRMIKMSAYGEAKPLDDRSASRRVEIKILEI